MMRAASEVCKQMSMSVYALTFEFANENKVKRKVNETNWKTQRAHVYVVRIPGTRCVYAHPHFGKQKWCFDVYSNDIYYNS